MLTEEVSTDKNIKPPLHAEARLDYKMVLLIKQLNLYLNHFPNHEKYGLAQQIRNTAYDVYGLIIECQKRYHKKTTLTSLDIKHEQLRMFVKVAESLGYFRFKDQRTPKDSPDKLSQRRTHMLGLMIDEIGRMINGWIKFDNSIKA